MIAVIKTIFCIFGIAAVVAFGIAVFFVIAGIILSFFGKNIYLKDLEDESNTEKQ